VVDCLLANFNNASLLMTGMRALGNLALYLPNIPAIVSGGGVQAIVAGLTVHAKNVPLVQIAVGVLTNLVWGITCDQCAAGDAEQYAVFATVQASAKDAESMQIMAQEGAVQAVVEVCDHSAWRDLHND